MKEEDKIKKLKKYLQKEIKEIGFKKTRVDIFDEMKKYNYEMDDMLFYLYVYTDKIVFTIRKKTTINIGEFEIRENSYKTERILLRSPLSDFFDYLCVKSMEYMTHLHYS